MSKLTISARSKGFPIRLTFQHLFAIEQAYAWLEKRGMVDDEMAAAYATLPQWDVSDEALEAIKAGDGGESGRWFHYSQGFFKSKTFRVRASHVDGMLKLLRLCGGICHVGQTGSTIRDRAYALSQISPLDLLADASR